jgi:hypothetical protein
MRKTLAAYLVIGSALGGIATSAGPAAAADTRVIKAVSLSWTSNGQSSDDGTPLIVDGLNVGDVIDIQIGPGISHGFITIKQLADVPDNEIKDPVLACGEDKAAKPNAVLRETECGISSNFGIAFRGSMKLEVLDTFKSDVNFWCVVHQFGMTGTLKRKP